MAICKCGSNEVQLMTSTEYESINFDDDSEMSLRDIYEELIISQYDEQKTYQYNKIVCCDCGETICEMEVK